MVCKDERPISRGEVFDSPSYNQIDLADAVEDLKRQKRPSIRFRKKIKQDVGGGVIIDQPYRYSVRSDSRCKRFRDGQLPRTGIAQDENDRRSHEATLDPLPAGRERQACQDWVR